MVTGATPEISKYLDFSFYEWVNYCANAGLGQKPLGIWLGVSLKKLIDVLLDDYSASKDHINHQCANAKEYVNTNW